MQEVIEKIEQILKEYNVALKVEHNIKLVPLASQPEEVVTEPSPVTEPEEVVTEPEEVVTEPEEVVTEPEEVVEK